MFDKLKSWAGDAALQTIINKAVPMVSEQIEKITALDPEKIFNDEFFDTYVTQPAWFALSSYSTAIMEFYPTLEEKFPDVMRHLRDQLVIVRDNKIQLVEDFQSKIPAVLMEGLKK